MNSRCSLFLLVLTSSANAFTTTTTTSTRPSTTTTPLHLTPSQGSDLVQASKNVYKSQDDDEDDAFLQENLENAPQQQTHHRSLVSRLFSLPSYLWHPVSKAETINFFDDELGLQQQKDHHSYNNKDVCYYPVVGFRYVTVKNDGDSSTWESRPVNQISHPSCQLHEPVAAEPVYGWFHPSREEDAQRKQ